jgi:hypothetical protein
MGTAFSLWLRQLPYPLNSHNGYYNTDIDNVWWAFREGWFVTLEEKQHGGRVSSNQQEVLDLLEERLILAKKLLQPTLRGERAVEYRGHYNIIFQNTDPDNSLWIAINNETHNKDALLHLLERGHLPGRGAIEQGSGQAILVQKIESQEREIIKLKSELEAVRGETEYKRIVELDWLKGVSND